METNVDLVMFDTKNKPFNVAVLNDVIDSLSEQETVDRNIEAAIVSHNEKQPFDSSTKETIRDSLRDIYEETPISNEHLQYALFSSQPTIFEEAMKDVKWVHANEEVNENDEVASIDEEHQDLNDL